MNSPSTEREGNVPLGRRISALMAQGLQQRVPGLRVEESVEHCFFLTTKHGEPICYVCGAVIGVLARLGFEQTKRELAERKLEGKRLKTEVLAKLLGVSSDHYLFVNQLHASFHDHKRKVEAICSYFLGQDLSGTRPPSS